MKITFKVWLYLGFTLAILLCAISGSTSYIILQKQEKQRLLGRGIRRILDSTTSIRNTLIDMETGKRGFRATNQTRFLEPYNNGLQHYDVSIRETRHLLSEDVTLLKKEILLEQHINNLLLFWKNDDQYAEIYSRDLTTKLTDEEKRRMDDIRKIIASLQLDENRSLAKSREEYDHLVHYGTLSSTLDSLLSEAIIIVLIFVVIGELKRRRRAQDQLQISVSQLESQTNDLRASESELKKAMDELARINKQLEKFVYTVAHDIKSPLSGIIGALSVLRVDETIAGNDELAEFIDLSAAAAAHLSGMVNSLLEYSRISITSQGSETINTKDLVQQITVLLFSPKNIEIKISENMPTLFTQKLKIEQVFQNLISNAIKYNGREKGLIEVGCNDKGNFFQFYVLDNGQGIPEEDKDKVFSLLATTTNKSDVDTSTGFGLSIVKLIVEEQGGKVWYDSTVGEGTTFYFTWMNNKPADSYS